MFVDAIETASKFTRPIHTIQRFFGATQVFPGAATLFFVNADGWALTCRHVAEQFIAGNQLLLRYRDFKEERDALSGKNRRQLEKALEQKFGFGKGTLAELKNRVVNCVEGLLNLELQLHPKLDVALLKFSGFDALGAAGYPVFATNGADLKQGRFLCRLGFPFPEFSNFAYDASTDSIDWNEQGKEVTPQFPIEGMVTRHLLGPKGEIVGFEMSTPGLRGQSGGPAFDAQGRVWGMQAATTHLDLSFDVDMQVIRDGRSKRITDHAILHVGNCIHVDVLKDFMREHGVTFDEGGST